MNLIENRLIHSMLVSGTSGGKIEYSKEKKSLNSIQRVPWVCLDDVNYFLKTD